MSRNHVLCAMIDSINERSAMNHQWNRHESADHGSRVYRLVALSAYSKHRDVCIYLPRLKYIAVDLLAYWDSLRNSYVL